MNIKWEEGAPAPVSRSSNIAVWLNGVVYVGGGFENKENNTSFTISCYDPVNNSWSSPIKTPHSYFSMTTLNNRLLIAGGKNKYYKETNQILTMDAAQFKNYTKMTTARSSAVAAGYQGALIITGGEDDKGKILSSTELFDSRNGQWYKCSNLPQPHVWLQSVIVDDILFLLGGENKDEGSLAVFTASLETLSRHKLNWSTSRDTPFYASAPVSVNGTHLLIVGGIKKEITTRTSNVYKLNKFTHSWKVIGQIPSAIDSPAAISTADNRIIVIGGENDKGAINTVWIGSCEPQ